MKKETKKSGRGGRRSGSGRKKSPSIRIDISVKESVVETLGGKDAVKSLLKESVDIAFNEIIS